MLSIVLLAYNERDNIPEFLEELLKWRKNRDEDVEFVFVNDGSTDDSESIAREILKEEKNAFVTHATNQGMGAGLKSGVRAASGTWVTFLPVDGQVPPVAITRLLDEQLRSNADVVFSVYENRNDGLHRKILSAGVRSLITAIHLVHLQSDGPYLFRRSLFLPEELYSNSFFLNFEFPIRVTKAGIKTAVVEVPCRPRMHGFSKSASLKKIKVVGGELLSLRKKLLIDNFNKARGK